MRKLKEGKVIFWLIILGSIAVRLHYIDFISVYDMQHDVGRIGDNYGHLGYISYLIEHHHLPDFDVREAFQFWHPPLHHLISAVWLMVMWKVFPGQEGNYESIQLFPLLYMTICLWILWKLLDLFEIEEKVSLLILLLISFHPTTIILSGSVNNDALCVMFSLLSVYLAILWYKYPTYKMILMAAVSVGLGMSSKGTTAVAAAPMALIFLVGLIKYKKKVLGQLIVFGVLSLPLGLWWYVKNYVEYGVPLTYIYRTSTDAIGYLGEVPLMKRILDFDLRRLSLMNVYIQFEGKYMEINPITALFKSAVYGQCWFNYHPLIRIVAYPMVFIWIYITGISLAGIPKIIRNKEGYSVTGISLTIFYVVQFISYYTFCLEYPFVWTMDIRYAVPLLFCQCVFLGIELKEAPKWRKSITYAVSALSGLSTAVFFLFSFTTFS